MRSRFDSLLCVTADDGQLLRQAGIDQRRQQAVDADEQLFGPAEVALGACAVEQLQQFGGDVLATPSSAFSATWAGLFSAVRVARGAR